METADWEDVRAESPISSDCAWPEKMEVEDPSYFILDRVLDRSKNTATLENTLLVRDRIGSYIQCLYHDCNALLEASG